MFGNKKETKDGVNANTAASLFLSVKGVWGIDELVGLLRKGFAGELQLCSGSENGLKKLEVKGSGRDWREAGNSCGRCRCQEKQGCEESLHSRFRSPFEDTRCKSHSPGRYGDEDGRTVSNQGHQ